MNKYEAEIVCYGPDLYNQSVISSLTSLDLEEANDAVNSITRKILERPNVN